MAQISLRIAPGDFDDPRVRDLLERHQAGMHAHSPPGTCHVLDLSRLQRPDISFFAAWDGESLAGIGALKELEPGHGEIKSMRTADSHLGHGVGRQVLTHLLELARSRGYRRVSLETGAGPAFAAALTLYARFGFVEGEPFADYTPSDFNRFFHLDMSPAMAG